jgi:hypothetical protein
MISPKCDDHKTNEIVILRMRRGILILFAAVSLKENREPKSAPTQESSNAVTRIRRFRLPITSSVRMSIYQRISICNDLGE